MISEYRLQEWTEWARRDDACQIFVPSEIRQILGEIGRLRATMRALRDDLILRGDFQNGRSDDGKVIVSVSQTIWNEFCAAIGDQASPATPNT